jgi:hypothetical protein
MTYVYHTCHQFLGDRARIQFVMGGVGLWTAFVPDTARHSVPAEVIQTSHARDPLNPSDARLPLQIKIYQAWNGQLAVEGEEESPVCDLVCPADVLLQSYAVTQRLSSVAIEPVSPWVFLFPVAAAGRLAADEGGSPGDSVSSRCCWLTRS